MFTSSILYIRLPLCRHYSSSKVRRGIGRYVASKLQRINTKYETFLKRRFPRFYQLYHTFVEGKPNCLITFDSLNTITLLHQHFYYHKHFFLFL